MSDYHTREGDDAKRSRRMTNRRYAYDVRQYAVLTNAEQHVLALQLPKRYRPYGDMWTLPGGKLEPADDPLGGILREVEEETNLKVQVESVVHIARWDSERSRKLVIFYHCTTTSNAPFVLSAEHQSARWVTYQEAMREIEFYAPYFRDALEKCLG